MNAATAADVGLSLEPDVTKTVKAERRIEHEWRVATVPGGEVIAKLSCWHSGSSKRFVATFSGVVRRQENGYATEAWQPFSDSFTVTQEGVARYSLRALDEFAQKALHLFTTHDVPVDGAAEILVRIVNENGGI